MQSYHITSDIISYFYKLLVWRWKGSDWYQVSKSLNRRQIFIKWSIADCTESGQAVLQVLIPLLRITPESQDPYASYLWEEVICHTAALNTGSLWKSAQKSCLQCLKTCSGGVQPCKGATSRNAKYPRPFVTPVEQQALYHSKSRLLWVFWLRMEATEMITCVQKPLSA